MNHSVPYELYDAMHQHYGRKTIPFDHPFLFFDAFTNHAFRKILAIFLHIPNHTGEYLFPDYACSAGAIVLVYCMGVLYVCRPAIMLVRYATVGTHSVYSLHTRIHSYQWDHSE